jgi:hypothetical protein
MLSINSSNGSSKRAFFEEMQSRRLISVETRVDAYHVCPCRCFDASSVGRVRHSGVAPAPLFALLHRFPFKMTQDIRAATLMDVGVGVFRDALLCWPEFLIFMFGFFLVLDWLGDTVEMPAFMAAMYGVHLGGPLILHGIHRVWLLSAPPSHLFRQLLWHLRIHASDPSAY